MGWVFPGSVVVVVLLRSCVAEAAGGRRVRAGRGRRGGASGVRGSRIGRFAPRSSRRSASASQPRASRRCRPTRARRTAATRPPRRPAGPHPCRLGVAVVRPALVRPASRNRRLFRGRRTASGGLAVLAPCAVAGAGRSAAWRRRARPRAGRRTRVRMGRVCARPVARAADTASGGGERSGAGAG